MTEDYGCDPLGNGQWRLMPSGQIVDKAGLDHWMATRAVKITEVVNDCIGLSWKQIENMQGGKLRYIEVKLRKK